MRIGAACLTVGFFNIAGLMMAVIAIWFAIPIHFTESIFVAKYGKLIKI